MSTSAYLQKLFYILIVAGPAGAGGAIFIWIDVDEVYEIEKALGVRMFTRKEVPIESSPTLF